MTPTQVGLGSNPGRHAKYKLKKVLKMGKHLLIIKADTNDGDYIEESSIVTDEEVEEILPVIEAIKAFEPYVGTKPDHWPYKHSSNYPAGEAAREDLGEKSAYNLYGHLPGYETFDEFVPYHEYGIHTIESVKLYRNVEKAEELL